MPDEVFDIVGLDGVPNPVVPNITLEMPMGLSQSQRWKRTNMLLEADSQSRKDVLVRFSCLQLPAVMPHVAQ